MDALQEWWDLQQMSSCLGDANEKQASERSRNPHGLSYLLLSAAPLASPPQPQIKYSPNIYKISTRNRESHLPSQASAHVPGLLG